MSARRGKANKEKFAMTKRPGKNQAARPSYAAQRLERPKFDVGSHNKSVLHRKTTHLEYLEGGQEEPTERTQREASNRDLLGRTRGTDFSASVDQYTSQDKIDPS